MMNESRVTDFSTFDVQITKRKRIDRSANYELISFRTTIKDRQFAFDDVPMKKGIGKGDLLTWCAEAALSECFDSPSP
jgi:hypothetical protein